MLVLPRRWASRCAAAVALAGAIAVPLFVLVATGQGQSEVTVIERSGELLLRHGTPYLAEPHTVAEYTPYLPGMALFGLPRALLGSDGWPVRMLGDARVWCAAAFFGCLVAAVGPHRTRLRLRLRREHRRRHRGGPVPASGPAVGPVGPQVGTQVAALIASPPVALPLCVSGVDLPLTGLCCLALALAGRARPLGAGAALALACALKWTAWPAVAVVAALLAATAGRRAAVRATATALVGTAAIVLPGALRAPGPLVQQVFAFPTGRGGLPTPASSPLPGRILADLGPAGWYTSLTLLLLAGLAVAASLALRPPRDATGAADRLALGLGLAFLLAPAGRFGYLALPALLVLLARLSARDRPGADRARTATAVPAVPAPSVRAPALLAPPPRAGGCVRPVPRRPTTPVPARPRQPARAPARTTATATATATAFPRTEVVTTP
ncbi:glycosyltransferase 87 family protein [Kitasatospora sp. NPDC058201]|uniref:glycosyltransferase 87 family protein n=1 Tax=unclassified Kitasatospora TaxID=2633591 RepID=UPI003655B58C